MRNLFYKENNMGIFISTMALAVVVILFSATIAIWRMAKDGKQRKNSFVKAVLKSFILAFDLLLGAELALYFVGEMEALNTYAFEAFVEPLNQNGIFVFMHMYITMAIIVAVTVALLFYVVPESDRYNAAGFLLHERRVAKNIDKLNRKHEKLLAKKSARWARKDEKKHAKWAKKDTKKFAKWAAKDEKRAAKWAEQDAKKAAKIAAKNGTPAVEESDELAEIKAKVEELSAIVNSGVAAEPEEIASDVIEGEEPIEEDIAEEEVVIEEPAAVEEAGVEEAAAEEAAVEEPASEEAPADTEPVAEAPAKTASEEKTVVYAHIRKRDN